MAVNLMEVTDQVKTWANRNRAIIALADALEQIGSLDQARAEAESRLAVARVELDEVAKQVEEAKALGEGIKAEVDRLREEALNEAAKVKSDAYDAAATMMQEATARAEEMVKSAAETARLSLDALKGDMNEAAKAAQDARAERNAALDERDAARDELAEIQKRIAAAKAEAKRLLEG